MKNKKGKKLVVLGAMAALLTLIGVSGSQTYAKYVEDATVGAQSATVAKWGFVVSADGTDLFGEQYDNPDANSLSVVNDGAAGVGLTINGSSEVVAPGSKGSMDIVINGQAEVDYKLSFAKPTQIKDVVLDDNSNTYFPIKWQLTGTINGNDVSSAKGTLESVMGHLDAQDTSVNAGDTLSVNLTLSWEWAYTGQTTSIENPFTPETDTLSGDQADTLLAILATEGANVAGGTSSHEFGYEYNDVFAKFGAKSSWTVSFNDFKVSLEQEQKVA